MKTRNGKVHDTKKDAEKKDLRGKTKRRLC